MPRVKEELMDNNPNKRYSCEELVELINIANHDVKKFVSIVHGYISLIQLDVEEGGLSTENCTKYLEEMETAILNSYTVMDDLKEVSKHVICKED